MHPLRSILRKFSKAHGIEGGISLHKIQNQWSNIVGEIVAAHTFPDVFKTGILTILVDTPQWMHHLSFYKHEIIEKLAQFNVREIRFRIGKIPANTTGHQNIKSPELSDDDSRFLENTLRNVKDEELKEKFRRLITHGLSCKRQKE